MGLDSSPPHAHKEPLLEAGGDYGSINANDVAIDCPNCGCSVEMSKKTDHDHGPGTHSGKLSWQSRWTLGPLATSVMTMSTLSLGVGIFVLPSALNTVGVALGVALIWVFAFLSDFATQVLVTASRQTGLRNYHQIVGRALGIWGNRALNLTMALTLFIGNTGHMTAVTSIFHDIVIMACKPSQSGYYGKADAFEWETKVIFMCILLAMALPLTFKKTMDSLKYISALSVILISGLSIVCTIKSIVQISNDGVASGKEAPAMATFTVDIISTSATICFAFTTVLGLFPVYREMPDTEESAQTMYRACHISVFLCAIIYTLVALFGILAFGTGTEDNFLYNFPAKDYFVTILCGGLVVVITLDYPVLNLPMVSAIEATFWPHSPESYWRPKIITLSGMTLAVLLSVAVPSLSSIFGLCGSLGLGSLCYILPCLVFLKVDKRPFGTTPTKWIAALVLSVGFVVTVAGTIVIVLNLINPKILKP